jgi:hypothetical protein
MLLSVHLLRFACQSALLSIDCRSYWKAGIDGQGGGIPLSIEGTTSDPKFVPNVKAIAGKRSRAR